MDPVEQAVHHTLVIKCQIGDRHALRELFLRHNRALGYYLGRMVCRNDVADLQQEVWLSVIRRISQLRTPEAFVVWLYQIARRQAVNRMANRRPAHSLDAAENLIASSIDPEPEFSPADATLIHEGLARLSPQHREVLLLRFMEDMSYEQIAEVIGCNVGTVRSRLYYAKLALRRQMEDHHD